MYGQIVRASAFGCAAGVLALVSCGCGNMPTDLPPPLAYVVDNKELFAQKDSSRLADVTAGTVIDDLGSLSGCWGAYRVYRTDFGGAPQARDYYAQMFDAETGATTSWLMQDLFSFFFIIAESTGTFSVVGDSTIACTYTEEHFRWVPEALPDPPAQWFEELGHSSEWSATLAGDHMKWRVPGAEEDESNGDSLEEVVFVRFDCPE